MQYVQILNLTTGQKANQTRLAPDGFFSSAVPVVDGANRIEVTARASDGSIGRDAINVYYQSGNQKSLDLEVFLEKEKNLKLEVERLGKSQEEIERESQRNRDDSLRRPNQIPTVTPEGSSR